MQQRPADTKRACDKTLAGLRKATCSSKPHLQLLQTDAELGRSCNLNEQGIAIACFCTIGAVLLCDFQNVLRCVRSQLSAIKQLRAGVTQTLRHDACTRHPDFTWCCQ